MPGRPRRVAAGPMRLGAVLAAALPRAPLGLGLLEAQHQGALQQQKAPQPAEAWLLSGRAVEAAAAGEGGGYRFRNEKTGRVDVDQCEQDFPDFHVYLERAFGMRKASAEDLFKEPEMKFGGGRMGLALELHNGKVQLNMFQTPRGEFIKRTALLKVLHGVVDRQQDNLRPELERLGGNVSMYWRFMNGDCPESRLRQGLPLHGYSSDQTRADVAMPDFTFEHYKDIHSKDVRKDWKSEAWGDVSDRLREIKKEKKGFIWRGSLSNNGRQKLSDLVNAGPPEHLKPLLAKVAPDGFDVTISRKENNTRSDFVSLYDQCKYAYTFHVPGKHYSAMLKYKLACNQTVFMVRKPGKLREEFFYEALHHGNQIFYLKEDLSDLWQVIEEAFAPSEGMLAGEKAAQVAAGGRRVADTYLSQRGIDCYVMTYLKRYYFPFWEKASKCKDETCGISTSSLKLKAEEDAAKHCATPPFGECDCEHDSRPEMV